MWHFYRDNEANEYAARLGVKQPQSLCMSFQKNRQEMIKAEPCNLPSIDTSFMSIHLVNVGAFFFEILNIQFNSNRLNSTLAWDFKIQSWLRLLNGFRQFRADFLNEFKCHRDVTVTLLLSIRAKLKVAMWYQFILKFQCLNVNFWKNHKQLRKEDVASRRNPLFFSVAHCFL